MPFTATATQSDCFSLDLRSTDTTHGRLQAFGRYWVWGVARSEAEPALQLYEETPRGIAPLPTESHLVHVVTAGTPFHLEGVFGYWLTADCDTHWLQMPQSGTRHWAIIAGGMTGAHRRHAIRWRCRDCGEWLGEPVPLSHRGTPESFLEAQAREVDAFNESQRARTCRACGVVHPKTYGFDLVESPDGASQAVRAPLPRRGRLGEAIASVDEIGEGNPLLVQVQGLQIGLRRVGEEIYAVSNSCPHSAGPLAFGEIRRGAIVCPWHLFRFDLETGVSATDPEMRAAVFPVEVREGAVYLGEPRLS